MSNSPKHGGWEAIPLRYVCKLNPPVTFDDLDEDDDVTFLPMDKVKAGHFVPHVEKVSSNAASYNAFGEGDILLAKVTPCFENGNIAIAENLVCGRGFGSSELFVLRPTGVLGRFLFYSLQSPLFKQEGEASMTGAGGLKRVSPDILRQYRIDLPNESTQQAIADYLDRETARVDALIAAKERLLGLLAEKRQALITRAVTRGLEPNAPMRDSGIPWLGPVPEHWETVALRFLVDIMSGATPDTGESEYWDGEIPWVSPKDMKRDEIADSEDHVTNAALADSALRLVPTGAVLVVVRGMILAHSFPVALTARQVTINQDMKALLCRPAISPHYLRDFLRGVARNVVSLADASAHGTRKLETEVLGRLQVCVPPIREQSEISERVAAHTGELDRLSILTAETIALLKERRCALIAAAVTGQIPVPSESIP